MTPDPAVQQQQWMAIQQQRGERQQQQARQLQPLLQPGKKRRGHAAKAAGGLAGADSPTGKRPRQASAMARAITDPDVRDLMQALEDNDGVYMQVSDRGQRSGTIGFDVAPTKHAATCQARSLSCRCCPHRRARGDASRMRLPSWRKLMSSAWRRTAARSATRPPCVPSCSAAWRPEQVRGARAAAAGAVRHGEERHSGQASLRCQPGCPPASCCLPAPAAAPGELVVLEELPQGVTAGEVEVQPVWGIDPFTRKALWEVLGRCPELGGQHGAALDAARTRFLEQALLPAINRQGANGW